MGRLAGHLLQQQSFAPQFPPSATSQYQVQSLSPHILQDSGTIYNITVV